MKKIVFVWFLLSASPVFAQKYYEKQLAWESIHNGNGMLQKENGNYLIACEVKNNETGKWKPYIAELNANGDILYLTCPLPDDLEGTFKCIASSSNGGFVAAGAVFPTVNDIWQNYLYNDENEQFTVGDGINSACAYSCAVASNGDILAGGYIRRSSMDGRALHLVRLDSSGATVFDTTYAQYNLPVRTSYFESISPTTDGGAWLLASVRKSKKESRQTVAAKPQLGGSQDTASFATRHY